MIIKKLVGFAGDNCSSYLSEYALKGLIVGNHYEIDDNGTFVNNDYLIRRAEVYLWEEADCPNALAGAALHSQCDAVTIPGYVNPSIVTSTLTDDDGDHIQETLHTLPREPGTTGDPYGGNAMTGHNTDTKPTEKGQRFNNGKAQFSYILDFGTSLEGLSKVMEFGAKKYSRGNWKKGLDPHQTIDSLMRHLIKYCDGHVLDLNEDGEADKDHSGLPHVDHISFNALALATFGERDVKEEE